MADVEAGATAAAAAVTAAAVTAPTTAAAAATVPAPIKVAASDADAAPAHPEAPLVEVRYKNITHSVMVSTKHVSQDLPSVFGTLGRIATAPFRAVGGLAGRALGLASATAAAPSKVKLNVLTDFSGVIKPGTLTLVLAPPGHGKSAFLKAITRQLAPSQVTGTVTFSGSTDGVAAGCHLGQLVQYVSQLDEHLPHLTVQETLQFVHQNATVDPAPFGYPHLAGQHADQLEAIIRLLHLQLARNTIIGNDLMRGVSGGEKKRVTVGEGILTNARVLALDEISTGLDSAVTFEIVASLKARAQSNGLAVVISLLQPTPEVYALFDDIVLIREGHLLYHGARAALPGYLTSLGYNPPGEGGSSLTGLVTGGATPLAAPGRGVGSPAAATSPAAALRLAAAGRAAASPRALSSPPATGSADTTPHTSNDMADWLVDWLTSPADMAAREARRDTEGGAAGATRLPSPAAGTRSPTGGAPGTSTAALAAAWKASSLHAAQMGAPPAAPPLELRGEWAKAQFGHSYSHAFFYHVWFMLLRQFALMRRNPLYLRARLGTSIIMAVIMGGLYFQRSIAEGATYYGTFLNAIMNLGFSNLSEMATSVEAKYIAKRHTAKGILPSGAFIAAGAIAHLPVSIVANLVYVGVLYSMTGLYNDAAHFFFFILISFTVDIFFRNMMALFSYGARSLQAAQAYPMPIIALLLLFGGFLVAPSKMGWMKFIFYIDIFGYSVRALAQNEFLSPRYDIPLRNSTLTLGQAYLDTFGMETDPVWRWVGVGFNLGSIVVIIALSYLAFVLINVDRNIGARREPVADAKPANGSDGGATAKVADASIAAASAVAVDVTATTPAPAATAGGAAATSAAALPRARAVSAPAADVAAGIAFQPMTVTFQDLSYTVTLPARAGGGKRTLLQSISGYALPGRLLALMGASGAGKTTLLDVLAGRKNTGVLTGSIKLNGFAKDEATFNRITAYVEQTDIHAPLTTVREAVEFSAALRLPSTFTPAQRQQLVEETLDLLELRSAQDRLVGAPGAPNALAPGERKRLTIAVEVVSNAPVIFLDEPTSGLASTQAAVVMRVIRNIANTGRTVICTVHQPSAELFLMFDDLLLLQRGGWQVYLGPLGDGGATLIDYLSKQPGVSPYPAGMNPSSWMLDSLAGTNSKMGADAAVAAAKAADALSPASAGVSSPEVVSTATPAKFAAPPSPSAGAAAVVPVPASGGTPPADAAAPTKAMLAGNVLQTALLASPAWAEAAKVLHEAATPLPGAVALSFPGKRARSWGAQLRMLVRRNCTTSFRNIGLNFGRLASLTILNLLFGTVYYKIADNGTDQAAVNTLIAAIFMGASFSSMINMNVTVPALLSSRPVLYREVASYMYDTTAYSLAYLIVDLPWLAFILLATTPIVYFMFGLSASAGVFFFHLLVTYVLAVVYVSIAMLVSSAAPTFEVAQAMLGILGPLFFLFGGMWSPPAQMAPGARWFCWIDPITYAFRAIIPPHFHCEGAGCPITPAITPNGIVPMSREMFVQTKYDIYYDDIYISLGYLVIFVAVFQVLGFLVTRYVRHIAR